SDLPPIARPFVKWSTEAHRLEDLPRIVHRAAKTALAHPTGPVFLSLPVDVLNAERDLELGAPTRVARRMVGDRAAVAQAAALLARAERPLLVAGDAVTHGDALAELVELAELVGAPVIAGGGGRCPHRRRAEADAARVPLAPLTLVHELARCTPANAVIVDESISSSQGVRHFFRCADRKSFFGLRGGGIGWGLPAALGVK